MGPAALGALPAAMAAAQLCTAPAPLETPNPLGVNAAPQPADGGFLPSPRGRRGGSPRCPFPFHGTGTLWAMGEVDAASARGRGTALPPPHVPHTRHTNCHIVPQTAAVHEEPTCRDQPAGDPIRPHRPHRAGRGRHPPRSRRRRIFHPWGPSGGETGSVPKDVAAVRWGGAAAPRCRHGVPRSPRTPAPLSAPHTARRARGVARGVRSAALNRGRRFVNPRRAESCKSRTAASLGTAPHRPAAPQLHRAAAPEPGGRPLPHRASAFSLVLIYRERQRAVF